jgi:hypothetical protein|tara:strand:+ start:610 stop:1020 length:411 start_codon:yes stop_codon:yes gene_type:complete
MNFFSLLNQPNMFDANPYSLSTNRSDMTRVDGTKKSNRGYLGQIPSNYNNSTMTELSTSSDAFNGRPYPLIVPTLTKDELKILQNMKVEGNASAIPLSIRKKALAHAKERDSFGLPLFYEDKLDSLFETNGLLSQR